MDIVKQRKKRLLAWLLAIVLCVSMWQGSVQATEIEEEVVVVEEVVTEEEKVEENVMTEEVAVEFVAETVEELVTKEIADEEVVVSAPQEVEEDEITVAEDVRVVETAAEGEEESEVAETVEEGEEGSDSVIEPLYMVTYYGNDNSYDTDMSIGGLKKTYKINSSKEMEWEKGVFELSKATDSITLKGTTTGEVTGKTYTHKVIDWSVGISGALEEGNSGNGQGTGNTIKPDAKWWWGDSNQGCFNSLDVNWERIFVVIKGTSQKAYYESNCANVSDDIGYEVIELPTVDEMNAADLCKDGYFFDAWTMQWGKDADTQRVDGEQVEIYYDRLPGMLTEIILEKMYGNTTVPKGGTFILNNEEYYNLSDRYSEWTVGDGYTYAGGISFCSTGGSYTFNATGLGEE